MRGRIIQYNGADGTGTLVADGRQYRFALSAWRGDAVPVVGRVVEADVTGDVATALTAVRDGVLLKEQVSRISGRFNTLVGAISDAGRPGDVVGLTARYGRVLLGAYAVFVAGTLFLDAIQIRFGPTRLGKSLFDIAGLLSQMQIQGGGGVKLLLLLAYASFFAPLFWPGKRAWLALAAPLVALVWAMVSTLYTAGHAVGPVMGGELGGEVSQMFSVGAGLYLSAIAALVLAAGGAWRALRAAR
jgi:hypothetical protein